MAAIAKLKLLASRKAAAPTLAAAPPAAAAAHQDDLAIPSDIHTVFLDGPCGARASGFETGDLWLLGAKVTCPHCGRTQPLERAIKR